jgi:hypothetical protein
MLPQLLLVVSFRRDVVLAVLCLAKESLSFVLFVIFPPLRKIFSRDRHTLAKCPFMPQQLQTEDFAGHGRFSCGYLKPQ